MRRRQASFLAGIIREYKFRGLKRDYRIRIRSSSQPNLLKIEVDGKATEIFFAEERGNIRLVVGGRTMDVRLVEDSTDSIELEVNDKRYTFEKVGALSPSGVPVQPKHPRQSRLGENSISSRVPGKVLQVRVGVGDVVKEGEPLLVLESMKMETVVKSPRDGTVKEIRVKPGMGVLPGDVLIILD